MVIDCSRNPNLYILEIKGSCRKFRIYHISHTNIILIMIHNHTENAAIEDLSYVFPNRSISYSFLLRDSRRVEFNCF